MTVSSSTNRVSYAGNGSTTVFPYTYKIFDQDDLTVILRAANGTETVQTITSQYTVSGVGNAGGGNVTMLTAPATGATLVILREQDLIQELDIVPNDPFPSESLEGALDRLTFMVQQQQETLNRTIKASRTNTISSTEFTVSAATRANKIFGFDAAGDLSITQELGTFRGNWATATAFNQRDIVKDGGNDNLYFCNTSHTSSGSLPISSNTDVAKWDLLLDVSAFTALYDQFETIYLGTKSSDPATDNDGNTLIDGALYFNTTDNRLKVYDLGNTVWKFTAPSPTEQTAINAVAAIAADVSAVAAIDSDVTAVAADAADIGTVSSNIADVGTVADISANVTTVAGISADVTAVAGDATDIGTVAGISSDVTTVAGISADVTAVAADATDIGTVAGISANVTTVAGISANVTTVAGISANVTTVAGISADVTTAATNVADITNFADVYVGPSATDPATRADSSALQAGDLYFNTVSDQMFVYDGAAWLSTNYVSSNVDINGGTIDGTVIGGTTPAAISGTTGQFGTSLNVDGTVTADGLTVDGDASISSSNARLRLFETDTTDLNTQFQNSGGDFLLKTLADNAASSTTRLSIDHSTGDISFYEDTGTTPKFFWDASAESLGIGTSSPDTLLHLESTDSVLITLEATDTTTQDEQVLGGIQLKQNDASNANTAGGYIKFTGDGNFGGTNLDFATNALNGSGESLAVRIDASGNLLVGTTSSDPSSGGMALLSSGFIRTSRNLTATLTQHEFKNPNGIVGNITTTGTSTAYNTSSDYRLKEDVQPMVGASDRVLALNPVNFAWKADGTRVNGFLAHEAQAVVPEAVTGTKDEVDADGSPVYQGIDQSKLVPLLTAALQEALQKIDALEARITALEA